MTKPLLPVALALAALAAVSCSRPAPKAAQPAFDLSLDMKEVMGHVIDPGAWAFWHASGENITRTGVESLTPKTEEAWEAAESGAAQVAEAGNLLLIPGYMRDTTDWPRFSRQLIKAGLDGKAAAEAHDPRRMFTTGAAIYQVCTGCHAKYVIPAAAEAEAQAEKVRPVHLVDWPDDVKALQADYERRAHPPTNAPDAANPSDRAAVK